MMSAHRFDDGENLLLLVAGQSGFELSFELGLGAALPTLRAVVDAQEFFHRNTEGLGKLGNQR
jgi:hypothetical protein